MLILIKTANVSDAWYFINSSRELILELLLDKKSIFTEQAHAFLSTKLVNTVTVLY